MSSLEGELISADAHRALYAQVDDLKKGLSPDILKNIDQKISAGCRYIISTGKLHKAPNAMFEHYSNILQEIQTLLASPQATTNIESQEI